MNPGDTSSKLRDVRLWKELTGGSDHALGELMRLHFKALLNYGYKFFKDEEFIKDCIQDVFIDLWHCRGRVTQPEHVKAYLFVSLRRKIFRNKIAQRPFDNQSSAQTNEASSQIEFSPEWWLIEEETTSQKTKLVAELLNTLPLRQREVIYLKYYQDMSREEIASVLSITPQTVSNLLQIAYAHLRKRWNVPAFNLFICFIDALIVSALEINL